MSTQEEDRRDAERYRALKAYTEEATRDEWVRFLFRDVDFDAEADRVVALMRSRQAEAEKIPISEKIETMVLAYLKDQTETGRFGSIYRNPDGSYTLTVDGDATFHVRSCATGWAVRRVGSLLEPEGLDADLLEAARLATESR